MKITIKNYILFKKMNKYIKYLFIKLNKKIIIGTKISAGRNYLGTICVRHKFSGNKLKFFKIDFFRRINSFGYVYKIISYNNRTANIASIIYDNGLFAYIIISENIKLGEKIYSGIFNMFNKSGNTSLLKNVKLFSLINNIELYPSKGSSLCRAAGTSVLLTSFNKNKAVIKLKSGWNVYLTLYSLINYGCVSNIKHKFYNLKKAGKSWSLGVRPKVRGVAMNPCDHPHGGGEGKKSPPSAQRSPWGWLTKGSPSLKKKYNKKKKKLYKNIK